MSRRLESGRRILAVVVAAVAWPVMAGARQAPQSGASQLVFRSRVDVVQTDVVVTDQRGQFVGGLTASDFEVLEDGRPQQITSCLQYGDGPAQDAGPGGGAAPERIYLLILDDLQTSAQSVPAVRSAAARFVEQYMEDGDVGAVVFASGVSRASQAFTSDRRRLLAAVARFDGSRPGGAVAMTESLTALAGYLAAMRDTRKTAVFFGPGALGSQSRTAKDLIELSNRAMLTFYVVNPVALVDRAGVVSAAEPSKVQGEDRPSTSAKLNALDRRDQRQQWLAYETGGFAVAGTSELGDALSRIRGAATRYYVLGYSPTEAAQPGTSHTLSVRVKRSGLIARARSAYRVPKESEVRSPFRLTSVNVPEALLPGLEYPARQRGVRFSAVTAVEPASDAGGPTVTVTLTVDARDLATAGRVQVDYAVLAVGEDGQILGHDVRRGEADLTDAVRTRLLETGLKLESRVRITSGTCTLRIALADVVTGRTGSAWIDVTVPPTSRP